MSVVQWSAPWDLRQRGIKDAKRHRERVREAIKQNLRHLIVEEAIITSQGERKVKIPVRYLTHYHFRHQEDWEGVGVGEGEPGDVIGRKSTADQGGGDLESYAGDRPGQAVYEAEVTFDELTEIMLEDLNLPRLDATDKKELDAPEIRFDEVRKTGLIQNLDKRRTLLENIKRHASKGETRIGQFDNSDLRYRVWRERKLPAARAAIYMLMDRSGSMSTEKRYIAKSFFFWLTRFLKMKYQHVELVFLAHDVEGEIVSEHDFFTVSASGGTRCSSAYHLALQHIKEIHPPQSWNNYVFHFTDGDNLPSDNERCQRLVNALLDICTMVGYGEIKYGGWGSFYRSSATSSGKVGNKTRYSLLYQTLSAIDRDNLILTCIESRDEIYLTLREFLAQETG